MQNDTKSKGNKITRLPKLFIRIIALKMYTRYDNVPGMYRNLQKLKPIYKENPKYFYRLSNLAYRQKKWSQSLIYIDNAFEYSKGTYPAKFLLQKANILIQMNNTNKAISYLNKYLSQNPKDNMALLYLAKQLKKSRQWKESINAYKAYLKQNPNDSVACFHLAECYQEISDNSNSEAYYKEAIKNRNKKMTNSLLVKAHYWLGCVQISSNPNESNKSFNRVIQIDDKLDGKRFGIGVFHEHYSQWKLAIDAYSNQIVHNKKDAELYYRIGVILDKKLYNPKEAIHYYKKALELDKVRSPWHYALANCYEQIGNYPEAINYFRNAIKRQEKHRPGNYRRLGLVLEKLGKTNDALDAFKNAELFSKPITISEKFYKNNIKKPKVRYAISYEYYPIDEKMIFYESLSGARMMDSPFAIFEHIYNKEDFKNYTHVWVVNSFDVIPYEYRSMDNIIFVKRQSDAYFKYISSAKYLICNSTFDPYVIRKPEQMYLQTSHGIFYKTVGRDSSGTSIGVVGSTRNLYQASHIIVPNEYMAEKQPRSYSFRGVHSGDIAKIGYPRIDVTVNMNQEVKEQILARLNVSTSKKTVLYVPTWRGGTQADNRFDSKKLIDDLTLLATLDINVIFRGHTISNRLLKNIEFPKNVTIPPPDILTNELLGIADIVISDYSSVFFDFLVTNRPIIHYLYDLETYKKERGLNLSEAELPGSIAKTSEELKDAVKRHLNDDIPSTRYKKAKQRFCPYDDGKSTERVVEWFFYRNSKNIEFVNPPSLTKKLYLIGDLNDQLTFSKLSKELKEIGENDDVITLLFSNDVGKNKAKRELVTDINNQNVNFVIHDKNMPTTIEEAFAIFYFNKYGRFINDKMESLYKRAYKRETRRIFGDSQFHKVINTEVDSNFYKGLQQNIPTVVSK